MFDHAFATALRPQPRVAVRGDALLHPLALASIALLLINDHFLKAAAPGFATGKISDFAGLLFFPLLLQAIYEVTAERRRTFMPNHRVLVVAIAVTGAGFAAVKAIPAANSLFGVALGSAQWILGLGFMFGTVPQAAPVTMDATDLVALPILLVTYWIGAQRCRS